MNNPKVSIIIPVYNGADYLKSAIDSALSQTYQNLEIIVVNDGSGDNGETERIALSYGEKIKYFWKANGGVASALNMAIARMEGDYFSWLSHDDYCEKNKVESEINALRRCGDDMAVVYSNYFIEDVDRQSKTTIRLEKMYDREKLEYSVYPIMVGAVAGCTVLLHVKHFEKIGKFDESLKTVQDYDFWFKLFEGRKNVFLEEPLGTVRWHRNQGSKTLGEYTGERDILYTKFLNILSWKEKERLFGSNNAYFCVMLRKFLEWGLKNSFWGCVNDIAATTRKESGVQTESLPVRSEEKSIYIFGAGKIGRSYAVILKMLEIDLKGFIDNDEQKGGEKYVGLVCRRLEEIEEKSALIIVAMKGNVECVFKQLRENGFHNIISWEYLESLLQSHIIDDDRILEYVESNKTEIEEIFGAFERK